jgi:LysM repeat protein
MTSSFRTDPQALQTASKAFTGQVEPINGLATKAEQVQGGPGNTGRAYSAEGSAYHSALLTFVQTQLTPMATKTVWVGDTLSSTAQNYAAQDSAASDGLHSAGQGA